MNDITDIVPHKEKTNKTTKILKNSGIIFKGASKAFLTFIILWFLSKKDMHGYKLMKCIDELFKPQIEHKFMNPTKANKIYPLLKTMTENGLIESYQAIHNKKTVKKYKLTTEGKNVLSLIKQDVKINNKRPIWQELLNDLKIT